MAKRKSKVESEVVNPLDELRGVLAIYLPADQVELVINGLGLTAVNDMFLVQEQHLTALGIKPIPALKLLNHFAPATPAPVPAAEEVPEKPSVKEASNPHVATQLGMDPMMLTALAMGGGDPSLLFGAINVESLLAMYDPEEPENLASVILERRFGSEPVIAFQQGSNDVAVPETVQYIKDRRRGYPQEESIFVNGVLARLYPVGVIPMDFVAEDPMVSRLPLRRERSTQYNEVNWEGVPKNVRQLVRIMVMNHEFDPSSRVDRNDVMRLARQGFEELGEAYPNARLRFNELEAAGKLPTLRVQLGTGGKVKAGGISEDADSFRLGRRSVSGEEESRW